MTQKQENVFCRLIAYSVQTHIFREYLNSILIVLFSRGDMLDMIWFLITMTQVLVRNYVKCSFIALKESSSYSIHICLFHFDPINVNKASSIFLLYFGSFIYLQQFSIVNSKGKSYLDYFST